MKVLVSNLDPKPFRKIGQYPFDQTKIEALKTSINEMSFWDNILIRPGDNGRYQIAYGHHRWKALRELEIKEIDIPCRSLDDAMMLKIMANENMDAWGLHPRVLNETVLAAKEFLDEELGKHKTWDNVAVSVYIKSLFASNRQFQNCKQHHWFAFSVGSSVFWSSAFCKSSCSCSH